MAASSLRLLDSACAIAWCVLPGPRLPGGQRGEFLRLGAFYGSVNFITVVSRRP